MRTERSVRGETLNRALTLIGSLLFAASTVLPAMRWRPSEVHPTSGSARVFGASDWTLLDGGIPGAGLVPLSVIAVVVTAMAAVATLLDRRMWWVQITALAVALYYPFWVLFAFAKKWDDQVFPAEGVAVLILAFAAMIAGSLLAMPSSRVDRRADVADP